MKRTALSAALDAVFIFVATAAAVFTVMRYYFKNIWAAVVPAVLCGTGVAVIFRLIASRKSAAYALKRKDAERMENALDSLCLSGEAALNAYFSALLTKAGTPFTEENGIIVLTETNTELRYYFTFSETYEGRIVEFYKLAGKGRKILVIGREFGEKAFKLTSRFAGRITLLDGAHLYLAMKKYDCFPESEELLKTEKPKLNLPRALFSKKRARQYLLYGITMEFFSFIVFYPLYYLFFGTALVLFSIICYFFGIENEPPQENPFKN